MLVYRVKQFLWAIGSFFKKIDYDYVRLYLDDKELELFNLLNHNDKHHSIRVCKDALSIAKQSNANVDYNKLGKIALLHDLGKSRHGLNIVEKSIIVLLDKFTNGKIKRCENFRFIDIYYNHSSIGADILEEFNYDKEFIDSIRYHHNENNLKENIFLDILKASDNKN